MKKYALLANILAIFLISCTTPDKNLPQKGNSTTKSDSNNTKNSCNNGQLNYGEECDGEHFGTAKCTTLGKGYTGGNLKCTANCKIDDSECTAAIPQNCGDGKVGKGEDCDGENLNGKSCTSFPGYKGGVLGCFATCRFDKNNCIPVDSTTDAGSDTPSPCVGPETYAVNDVPDGQPCRFDSDCAGASSSCLEYGFMMQICAGTEISAEAAFDAYIASEYVVPNYHPCLDDRDCAQKGSYCAYGIDIDLCLPTCSIENSLNNEGMYACNYAHYGHSQVDYGCMLAGNSAKKLGDTCQITEYDCPPEALCLNNVCATACLKNADCGNGFSCLPLVSTGSGYCFNNILLNKTPLGSGCFSSALCQSGLYCADDTFVCSKNPANVTSHYSVSDLADGKPCNQNFDCRSAICSSYYWDDEDNEGDIFDYICGAYNEDAYDTYLSSGAVSKLYTPCNYQEDCMTDEIESVACWWSDDSFGISLCVPTCTASNKTCPDGYSCAAFSSADTGYVCAPNQGSGIADEDCRISYWDCAIGFSCNSLSLTCQPDKEDITTP